MLALLNVLTRLRFLLKLNYNRLLLTYIFYSIEKNLASFCFIEIDIVCVVFTEFNFHYPLLDFFFNF